MAFIEIAVGTSLLSALIAAISALWAKHGSKLKSQNERKIYEVEISLHEAIMQLKELKNSDSAEVSRSLGLLLEDIQRTKNAIANEHDRQARAAVESRA